jgi:protein-S-isoprenylcysteine O-methyltransferase Ste14
VILSTLGRARFTGVCVRRYLLATLAAADLLSFAKTAAMVGKHIALTLIVGGSVGYAVWKNLSAELTLMQITGLILQVGGFVLWTVARFQLGASFIVSPQARQLVSSGIYSRIRNPIYIFGSCVIAGLILLLGYPLALLIFVVLIPLQTWRARKEAAVLEAKFGEQYRAYRASTWF